jgi:mediator of RNA polymerase II transcription subunit 10
MAYWDTPTTIANERTPATPRNPSTPAQDSPRPDSPVTPPPAGVHGDIELELIALAHALYNLGTTAINDNSREKPGPDGLRPEKKMGARVYEDIIV